MMHAPGNIQFPTGHRTKTTPPAIVDLQYSSRQPVRALGLPVAVAHGDGHGKVVRMKNSSTQNEDRKKKEQTTTTSGFW